MDSNYRDWEQNKRLPKKNNPFDTVIWATAIKSYLTPLCFNPMHGYENRCLLFTNWAKKQNDYNLAKALYYEEREWQRCDRLPRPTFGKLTGNDIPVDKVDNLQFSTEKITRKYDCNYILSLYYKFVYDSFQMIATPLQEQFILEAESFNKENLYLKFKTLYKIFSKLNAFCPSYYTEDWALTRIKPSIPVEAFEIIFASTKANSQTLTLAYLNQLLKEIYHKELIPKKLRLEIEDCNRGRAITIPNLTIPDCNIVKEEDEPNILGATKIAVQVNSNCPINIIRADYESFMVDCEEPDIVINDEVVPNNKGIVYLSFENNIYTAVEVFCVPSTFIMSADLVLGCYTASVQEFNRCLAALDIAKSTFTAESNNIEIFLVSIESPTWVALNNLKWKKDQIYKGNYQSDVNEKHEDLISNVESDSVPCKDPEKPSIKEALQPRRMN